MDKVKTIEIKCLNSKCGSWFKSPIYFEDLDSLVSSVMYGNKVQCPNCGIMTSCNKENMRARATSGGFKGIDT